MACPPVLGRELRSATVTDQSILGGPTMVAYEARWDLLGSGALPASPPEGMALADEIDVADLESEAAHRFARGEGWDTDDVVMTLGKATDGGRLRRKVDRFNATLPSAPRRELWVRLSSEVPVDAVITANGKQLGVVPLDAEDTWLERHVVVPPELPPGEVTVEVTARSAEPGIDARFGSFHYWVFGGSSAAASPGAGGAG
jgi:hypothetical protein